MLIKRLVASILSFLLLLSLFSCNNDKKPQESLSESGAQSESDSTTGTGNGSETEDTLKESPAEDFEYSIFETAAFTLENDDQIFYLKGCIYIKKYLGSDTYVVIPETINNIPVVGIGIHAFEGTSVETIILSDTIQLTGNYAFEGADNLVEVRGGASLRRIGERAFYNCSSLERVDLSSDSMRTIGKEAFMNCEKLVEVKLGSNITIIDNSAFARCTSLQSIKIPKSLTIKSLEIFANDTSLSEVVLEDGLTFLWGAAFIKCTSLRSVVIPASVTEMCDHAFAYSGLTEVTFLGNAPLFDGVSKIFPENVTVYYNPKTEGWESTPLRDKYTLIPIEE